MIVQALINWLSDVIAAFLVLIPPLPAEWGQALSKIGAGGAYLGGKVSMFSPVIPFDALSGVVTAFAGVVAFWALMMLVKLTLWAVGR